MNKNNIDDINLSLNRIDELDLCSLKKATPSIWYSLYWSLYSGVIISWLSYKGPFGFYIFFVISVMGLFFYREEQKKGVRLSLVNSVISLFAFRILTLSMLLGLAFTVNWISTLYNLFWFPFLSALIIMMVVFLWIEFTRRKLISKVIGIEVSE